MNTKPLRNPPSDAEIPGFLKTIFEGVNAAVAIFDAKGSIVYVNAAMATLENRLPEQVDHFDCLSPIDMTSASYITFERFRAGREERVQIEYELRSATEKPVWVDTTLQRYTLGNSGNSVIVAHLIDCSAKHESMAALEHSDIRWETALAAAGQGLWEFDNATQCLSVSRGWRRLRGLDLDDDTPIKRDDWLKNVHPDDRDRINTSSAAQGLVDGFDTLEYRERHPDGHYMWIYSRGRPYEFDADGNPTKTIGTDTDITRPKAIEDELAIEKERLRVTLHSIADGVISTDDQGTITFVNRAAETMTGWSAKEALGQHIQDVFDSRAEHAPTGQVSLVAQCLRLGRACRTSGYARLRSRKGRARYVREIAAPMRTDSGEVDGVVMVFQDATQRRRLQRELEHSATHDPLTGLVNRKAFENELEASLADATSGKSAHALCLLDLDHFKSVNDGAGHAAGDILLSDVAQLIKSCCRRDDCVARLGGDEFGLILKDCSIKSARRITQKIVSRVAAMRFVWQDQSFRIGASIGIAAIDGGTRNAFDLYRNADNACYAAKRDGRGRSVVFG